MVSERRKISIIFNCLALIGTEYDPSLTFYWRTLQTVVNLDLLTVAVLETSDVGFNAEEENQTKENPNNDEKGNIDEVKPDPEKENGMFKLI